MVIIPWHSQRQVLFLEPSRAVATVLYAMVTMIVVAVLVFLALATDKWPLESPAPGFSHGDYVFVASFLGVMGLLALVSTLVNGRRWGVSRAVSRWSRTSLVRRSMPDLGWATPQPTTPPPHPIRLEFSRARRLKRVGRLRRVRTDRNVAGEPPLRIAYLRLFENQPRARTFIQSAWRELGYVYFLRSAASVTPREYRSMRRSRSLSDVFLDTPNRVAEELDRPMGDVVRPHRMVFPDIAATSIKTRDPYGLPMRPLMCHGHIWKLAIDEVLMRVDLVVLDLSGFTAKNRGTGYELQHIIDTFPIARVTVLMDPRGKRSFVRWAIQDAWSRMATSSPNYPGGPDQWLRVAVTDVIRRVVQSTGDPKNPNVQLKIFARRAETRRLAAEA